MSLLRKYRSDNVNCENKVDDNIFTDCGRSFEAEFGNPRKADAKPRKILATPRFQL